MEDADGGCHALRDNSDDWCRNRGHSVEMVVELGSGNIRMTFERVA